MTTRRFTGTDSPRRSQRLALVLLLFTCTVSLFLTSTAQVVANEANPAAESATGGEGDGVLTTLGELISQGGVLMIPIGLASILMVAFAIERCWALRRIRILPAGLWEITSS